ncbi:hypothetical protein GCM10010435_44160 [Winogradskya consettensis]|uniref:DnaT DNA-binding domain-containing protein n=1 Tax=Winogradskya consettensis TaxID=113560 RepID=A0A919VWJ0_9ACTN|nr:hypothetical protein [Actinoplanes consettensis]GIM82645.1 hypothetical protein Aco04nite_82550 [Actinoplanes consettensis]
MARIRSIKPEFFTSLTIASLPLHAQMTFIGLWTHVDDEGRCVDDARLIKAAIWPLAERLASDVEEDLKALTESSLITRYKVGERSFLAVTNWHEHQRINRPTASKVPAPPSRAEQAKRASEEQARAGSSWENSQISEPSSQAHAQLSEDSPPERKGTGNREQGKEEPFAPQAGAPQNRKGTRIPADFTPDDSMRDWAKSNTPNAIVSLETANFVDHWTAKSGKDATKLDWVAAWRTWMRNAQKWSSEGSNRQQSSAPRQPHQAYREDDERRNDEDYWTKGL